MKQMKCPSCGADVNFSDEMDREYGFCEYCGTKIYFGDEEGTTRIIDVARIKEDETNRIVKLKTLDLLNISLTDSLNPASKLRSYVPTIIVAILAVFFFLLPGDKTLVIGIVLGVVALFMALFTKENNDCKQEEQRIQIKHLKNADTDNIFIPDSISDSEDDNYQVLQVELEGLGFKRIRAISLQDLNPRSRKDKKYEGLIEEVKINGGHLETNEYYEPNSFIEIKYHGFRPKKHLFGNKK